MPKLKLNSRIVRSLAPALPLAIPLIVLGTIPSIAATFASSESTVTLDKFSHNPFESEVITDTFTSTFATDGNVNASTDAVASFVTEPPTAFNSTFSSADGTGNNYSGTADSFAGVLGNFSVNSGETFSFNFDADLNLTTSIDNPQTETAIADGTVSFALYDTSNVDSWTLLDSFTISGNVTSGNNDFLNFNSSDGTQLNLSNISLTTNFGSDRESASASTEGLFSRTFDRVTNLTLVEVKENRSTVAVPEPSIAVGTILGIFALGYRAWNRRVGVK
ncbi:PEP-CTERM sorting domain-containing protein [Chroococcidiopsis sp. FACHB-1243]|uniref:PEP-CTERM sorting domain-containing protein n=1 Tax=Chroococcidiopsis sp. [FACHB-1243] TaxID=2692781 RepID=UPI00177A7E1B|nr:PEP-CTERM sorting domain-containing protein [Chroococcidiopsis sp. [FACHB-1243]]MBD2308209.1 PEP-CTERM sorting domain-containing protein [Chroococcidiopsis sp. [FACHB-1243]]